MACINSDASFFCNCNFGYILDADGKGCSSKPHPYVIYNDKWDASHVTYRVDEVIYKKKLC